MSTNENLHSGHRIRMKNKLLTNPESITDHELVEILLYYSIPRINTNEQAHSILNAANGSLENLFELTEKDIKPISGIGKETSTFLKVLNELYIRIEKEKLEKEGSGNKLTKKNISSKLHKLFVGVKNEQMMMLSLDSKLNILGCHKVSEGNTTGAVIPLKKIVNHALSDNATFVLFAHNHPNGTLAASEADIETTITLCKALSLVEIPVINHYIVTPKSELGIIEIVKERIKDENNRS